MVHSKLRHLTFHKVFLYSLYLPLLYYQELVDQYSVHYNRHRFGKIQHYYQRYALYQWRRLFAASSAVPSDTSTFFAVEKNPIHIRWAKYYLILYTIRNVLSIQARLTGGSREWRIALGTEVLGTESGLFIELTFLIWSTICILFFQFTLTSNLLDYKFMALNSMSATDSKYLHPAQFGLTERTFAKFRLFRRGAFLYLNFIDTSLNPIAFIAVIMLGFLSQLYYTHPITTAIYTVIHCYYIYLLIAVIYFNLISFVVVAYYAYLKLTQYSSRITEISHSLSQKRLDFALVAVQLNKLHAFVRDYSSLHAEIADYNLFWRSYLTFVFVFYVLLISLILFMALFAQIALIVNVAYMLVLVFHVLSLGAIIHFSGGIVYKHEQVSFVVLCLVTKIGITRLPVVNYLKVHNLSQNLKIMAHSGFSLLNGYLISHDTFRLLLTNIIIYFLLILSNTGILIIK